MSAAMFGYEFTNGTIICVALVSIAISLYWWNSRRYYKTYWKKKGVTQLPDFGYLKTIKLLYKMKFHEYINNNYRTYGKIYGAFERKTPSISIGDPELLRDIMVKDFHVFNYRREMKTGDVLTDNMVSALRGEDWKRIRTIITPAFTSKRMRVMGSIINECSKTVDATCEKSAKTGEPVDCKMMFGCFTMDVICRAAFGTKIDSASDPENPFVKHVKTIFQTNHVRLMFFLLLPMWLLRALGLFKRKESIFFRDVVLQVIKERKKSGKRFDDVLQILMDAADGKVGKEKEEFEDETDKFGSIVDSTTNAPSVKYKNLSEDELLAQCVLFFMVGYETTASTLTFIAYCLATNPEWQEKVIQEVDEAFRKHGEMSYDSVRDMKVLDAVMSETMRMYPIAAGTERTSDQDYELGNTGIVLEKGTRISIPIYALHYDEEYFPEPETFNPNRFLESTDTSALQYVYMPFGVGPRNCLGMRFAQLEIKMALANILRGYRFKRHATTKVPIELKQSFLLSVNDLPLVFEKRTDVQ